MPCCHFESSQLQRFNFDSSRIRHFKRNDCSLTKSPSRFSLILIDWMCSDVLYYLLRPPINNSMRMTNSNRFSGHQSLARMYLFSHFVRDQGSNMTGLFNWYEENISKSNSNASSELWRENIKIKKKKKRKSLLSSLLLLFYVLPALENSLFFLKFFTRVGGRDLYNWLLFIIKLTSFWCTH